MAAALRSRDLASKKQKGRRGSKKEKKKGPLPLFIRRSDTTTSVGIEELKKWISNNGVASMTGYALMKVILSFNEQMTSGRFVKDLEHDVTAVYKIKVKM